MAMTAPVFDVEGIVFVGPYGRLPVTNMFDIDRQPTKDPALACVIVAMLPNGKWLSTEVFPGELVREALS
jgi:hypothetical protein